MSEAIEFGKEARFQGLAISEGVGFAPVCLFNEQRHRHLPLHRVSQKGPAFERMRLSAAMDMVEAKLEAITRDVSSRIGQAEAQIFEAQRMILRDPEAAALMRRRIDEDGRGAEGAVCETLDYFEARLRGIADDYLRERATDIGDVRRRLLDALSSVAPDLLCAESGDCQAGRDRIVVASELTPALTVAMDPSLTRGLVTEHGGPASHAAILARAFGIPAVSGIERIHSRVACGTHALVDGRTGRLIVWPSKETLRGYPELLDRTPAESAAVEPVPGFRVMANISHASQAAEAARARAEGIGLYRTEFEFFSAGRLLSEDEQFELYAAVASAMRGQPAIFRLFDIGGDKNAPFLDLPRESNPYLGLRSSRYLAAHPEILAAQARALARAAEHGEVWAMYPMIIDVEQYLELRSLFERAAAGLPGTRRIRHGVMFEAPSACLEAEELFRHADFGSIGANDLIQYLFAVDRGNERVAYDYRADRPAFWRIVGEVARAARAAGRELSVCGEAAGDPALVGRFRAAGVRSISVSPRLIGDARRAAMADSPAFREA